MADNLSFIIILEFVAPFAILSVLLFIALIKKNKKNKKGLTQLLHAVQKGEEDYKQKLKQFLSKSGVEDDQLEDLVQTFCKSRRAFFKQTLSALNNGDSELLKGLGGRFSLFSDLYHQLELTTGSAPVSEEEGEQGSDVNTEAHDELEATYKVVKRENKRLKAEVHVSVSALNSLFKEYSSMFGEVATNPSEMSVQEVLEAMEKFTKGDFKPDDISKDIPPEDKVEARPANETDKESPQAENDSTETMANSDTANEAVSNQAQAEEDDITVETNDESTQDIDNDVAVSADEQETTVNTENDSDTASEQDLDSLDVKLEDIVVEDDEQAVSVEDETEPSWDEAFEETGDTPDESAVEQLKQAEQAQNSTKPAESEPITEQATNKPDQEHSEAEKPPKSE